MIILIAVIVGLVLLGTFIGAIISRYRMCPPDKILVVYGAIGQKKAARCHAGGAAFVLPVLQSFGYLDLRPISIDVPLRGALSSQNIRIDVPSSFTIGISTEPGMMENAATRLLGLKPSEIQALASEIILGQMRVAIASMTIEEINADREKLVIAISKGVDTELNKVGLKMINCNISDIKDASGYIEALGREAAARAINEANIKVAEETKKGEVGKAEAERDQAIAVAQAEAASRLGQNESAVIMAESDSQRYVKEAGYSRAVEVAQKIQEAAVLEAQLLANAKAELARAEEQKNKLMAEKIVPAEIAKKQAEINAEAQAQMKRLVAKGEADAVVTEKEAEATGTRTVLKAQADGLLAKLQAEAEGAKSLLTGRAEGFEHLLQATGNDLNSVARLLVSERIVELTQTAADAASRIRMDKVVVMGGAGAGAGGSGSGIDTLIKDVFKAVLPVREITQELGIPFMDSQSQSQSQVQGDVRSSARASKTSSVNQRSPQVSQAPQAPEVSGNEKGVKA
jgi:flotillin